jgi:glucose/arabinose dehydrogenase
MRPVAGFTTALLVLACEAGPSPAQSSSATCAPDNAGLTLPPGFCAGLFADDAGAVRHIVVAPNGDVFAAVRNDRARGRGGVLALRDSDGDGRADVTRRFGPDGGSGIALAGGYLYFATNDAVVRWRWNAGQLEPAGAPDTIAAGLLNRGQHGAKTIAVGADGALFVNIGAPSNACQNPDRRPGVPGMDPCPLLDSSGGIWRFDAGRPGQRQRDGRRWATGLRNVVALALDPATGSLYGAQHGRDQLSQFWPQLYTDEQNAENPAEELFRLAEGGDHGWPYCYYDPQRRQRVLAPEYGGDGRTVGRCASYPEPLAAFPAHWAPNALLVYRGTQFPAEYRGGIFVAFHGSWNRAPLPQQGFNVVFQPLRGSAPAGPFRVFAEGFQAGGGRPTGLAEGPDGSLYVSDDSNGRVYRIRYAGT